MDAPRLTCGSGSSGLLGRLGVLLQVVLAVFIVVILMIKRLKEPEEGRRPWKIWFFDISKQGIGAVFIHFANVVLAEYIEEDPCFLYLMNFILDATLGMLLIWLGVKVVSWIVHRKKYACLVFGEYGDPPQTAAWIFQCILYLLIILFGKTLISLFLFIPGRTKLQQILLAPIPSPDLQLIMFVFVVPFIVNVTTLWVGDSLVMRKNKQKDTLDINGSTETPHARQTEESQLKGAVGKWPPLVGTQCQRNPPSGRKARQM